MKRITYCPSCNGLGHVSAVEATRSWSRTCSECQGKGVVEVPITNYERVLQDMTPEKLGAIFDYICDKWDGDCHDCPVHDFAPWVCENAVSSYNALLQEATK